MFSETGNGKTIQLIKGKENIAENIFTTAIVLELIVMMTDHLASWTLPYRGRVTHVAFVLFCIKMLMTKYDFKQIAMIIFAGLLGVISYCTCKDEYVIRAVVFVAAASGVNADKNLKIIFRGALLGSIIIILLAVFGICGDIADVRHYGRGMVETRYCLGFNHANNVHCMFWYILVIYLMFKKRISVRVLALLFVLNIITFGFTHSRTGVFTVGMTIIGIICIQYYEKVFNRFVLSALAFIELIIVLVLTMYAAIYLAVDNMVLKCVDKLLTGRLEMVSERAYVQLWKIFPPSCQSPEVDNAFAGITYSYGIIVGIFLICIIVFCIVTKFRRNDKIELLILLSVIGMYFMESTYIFSVSLLCNILLILMWNTDNHIELEKRRSEV